MILIEKILGKYDDRMREEKLKGYTVDYLGLDQWEAQKNRFRKETGSGLELAISLPRNTYLNNGDILLINEAEKTVVVAMIELREVMVIKLSGQTDNDKDALFRIAFELGHAVGNQHWPAVIKDEKVFVPLTVDRKVMSSVMRTHAFQGLDFEFVPGSEVIPYLAPHEARRLFAGAESTPHVHYDELTARQDNHHHDNEHGHAHDHEHTHDHVHEDGINHQHPHDHEHVHNHLNHSHTHDRLHDSAEKHDHAHKNHHSSDKR